MEASVPALGSVSAKAPSFSPEASGFKYFSFCAGVPNFIIGQQHSEVCAERMMAVVAQTFASSSMAST